MVTVNHRKTVDMPKFRHLYPFESQYININGFKYHYIDQGIGDPIIMIHGNPTWSFYFRSLIRSLSLHYRTIAPDHIGCGLSEKPNQAIYSYRLSQRVDDLEYFLDSLALNDRLTLILHDWGGMIGMAYAVDHPEQIGRIILMNTAAFLPPNGKKLPFRLKLARNGGIFSSFAVLGLNLFVKGALYMAPYRKLKKEVQRGLVAPYNSWHNRIGVLKFVQDIPIKETDESYAKVQYVDQNLWKLSDRPMLICWGQHDFVFDVDYLREWQRRFPDSEIFTFSDAGHYALEDVPGKILEKIQNFLKKYPV
jgi:haloalkane dehalogenase